MVRNTRRGRSHALPRPTADEVPKVNQLVHLTGPVPDEVPSRVEDVVVLEDEGVALRVASPRYAGDLVSGDDEWLLTWVTDRGHWELPVRRREVDRPQDDGPPSWWLIPLGPVERNQRRNFFRVEYHGPVTMEVRAEPPVTLVGRALDLSEGGLRGFVADDVAALALVSGTRTLVTLELEELDEAVEGVVLRSSRRKPALGEHWHVEFAVAFDSHTHTRLSDALRRAVLRLEVANRRVARPHER